MQAETRQALLALGAEQVGLGGNEAIRLDQQPYAWLVEEGKVEIFAAPTDPESRGWRTHVATIETGGMVFGILPRKQAAVPSFLRRDLQQQATALLAVGSPDTRLLRMSIQGLVELARDPDHVADIGDGIERWLADIFAKVPRSEAPKRFSSLTAGNENELEAGAAARSASGVVWVRHLTGRSYFLGREELLVESSGSPFPVSDETWLVAETEVSVSCIGTEYLVRSGTVWEGLERFHHQFVAHVSLVVQAARRREAERLQRRKVLDRSTLDRASRRLAAVLDDSEVQALPGPSRESAGDGSRLFAALSLVAEAQGIELEAPTDDRPQRNHGHGMTRICSQSRIRHRLVMLRDQWWTRDNGPLLGFIWKDGTPHPSHRLLGRPVALLPTSPRSYEMVDPERGERVPVDAEVAATLEGEAFMLYPRLPERPVRVWDLARMAVFGRRRDLITLLAMGALTGLLALLVPVLTGNIFGVVIPSADRSRLVQMSIALGVAALATFGFRITRAVAILRLSGKLDGSVQAAVWDRLLALPVSFYKQFSVGDLVARSMGIDHIRTLLLGNVTTSFLDAVFSVFSLALLFYYDWRLALVALTMVLILVLVTAVILVLQVRRQRTVLSLNGKLSSLVFGLLNGIEKLRGAGVEARALALWAERFGEMREVTLEVRRLANVQAAFNAVYAVLTTMVLFATLQFWSEVQLSVSEFLAFAAAFGQFKAASLSLIGLLSSVLTMIPLYERLRPVLDTPPEVSEGKSDPGELSGDLELSHVSFRYQENGPLILDELSIRAKPGEFIALVGPSGSGKSTTLRLLLGFEQPEAGSIYFDGQDLPSLNAQSVRRQIGVVLQNGKPMSGDIFQNIVGSSNLAIEDAWEAARMAGLEDDIKDLPMGMHSLISEEGGGFSGGQIQRLMIARAVVQRPRILLFDEATSALDNYTQELVSRSLEQLKATRIVVAHRLSTVRNADRIYVIEKGRVTQQGSYQELMAVEGTFAELASRQTA